MNGAMPGDGYDYGPPVIVAVAGGSPSRELVGMYTPTMTSITPTTAVMGGPDLTLTVTGSNFMPPVPGGRGAGTVIRFNGGDETTTYVNSTTLTTGVKPSLAGVPGIYPVTVHNIGIESASRNFSFTPAPPLED